MGAGPRRYRYDLLDVDKYEHAGGVRPPDGAICLPVLTGALDVDQGRIERDAESPEEKAQLRTRLTANGRLR